MTNFRTYEIYQRERVGESTALLKPRELYATQHLVDPYRLLGILREHYPCYRDWPGNAFWVTRYDDVTSVFADDANYESRSKRWLYGLEDAGRNLRDELAFLECEARHLDTLAVPVAEQLVADMRNDGRFDLAVDFCARFPIEMLGRTLGLGEDAMPVFIERYLRMQRGVLWEPAMRHAGLLAIDELSEFFDALLADRLRDPSEDLVSVIATLELPDGPANGLDIVVTLLEADHETLHGALANMWFLLLTHPEQLDIARTDERMMRHAYLETLRHSTPVLTARRFARHEVERFGRLLPDGALVKCSAGAANRDPRVFADPDRFDVTRPDLCQREPRGMYRADGLCSGIAFGLGQPSKHPALPEDRPRSRYALTRDAAVRASQVLVEALPGIELATGAAPVLRSLRVDEMHTCWHLPVTYG